jgi:6-phosphogluconolactonase
VPPDDAESNYHAAAALVEGAAIPTANVHRMPADAADLEAAAAAHAGELARAAPMGLDLVHLGMGPDGHVCSLFPGHAQLAERDRLVAAVLDSPKPPPRRLTLTLPALRRAHGILFTVTGAEKAAATQAAIEDGASRLPAALVTREAKAVTWLLDPLAAQRLARAAHPARS